MMLVNSKHDSTPAIGKKPIKFNFGGLIKKKMTWKKSIDSLTSAISDVQIDYTEDDDTQNTSYSSSKQRGSLSDTPAFSASSQDYSSYSLSSVGRMPDASQLSTHPRAFPSVDFSDGHYLSLNTECVSLSNSEMTSGFGQDDEESINQGLDKGSRNQSHFIPFDPHLEEDLSEYKSGGYHPVKIGDKYASDINHYRIVRKLGWGHFSTVWLCESLMTGEFVAMKIVKSGSNYSDAARDEIHILRSLQGQEEDDFICHIKRNNSSKVVNLLDNFVIRGPNGSHIAMVFELMGENLLHLVYKYRAKRLAALKSSTITHSSLLPMEVVKSIVKQILSAVHYMHQHGIIHTDLKPENILLSFKGELPDRSSSEYSCSAGFQILPSDPLKSNLENIENSTVEVKIADLGNATHSHLHFTNNIQTRQYRAPEVILKHSTWGASADVWSIGCLIFELLTGDYLFEPKDGSSFSKDEDHLAQIIELTCSCLSRDYLSRCELSRKYFDNKHTLRNIKSLKYWPLEKVLIEKYRFDAKDDNVKLVSDLISKCLKYDLRDRYDCGSLLLHPWFAENPRFDQKECDALPNRNYEIPGFTCEE